MDSMKLILLVLFSLILISGPVTAGHHSHHEDKGAKNIVETAVAAGQFETLVAAATAAGLADALQGEGPLTVFAPTDEAFGALPAGTIASLLKPENQAQLVQILKFHVIPGRVGSDSLADGAVIEMLSGALATISAAEQGFTIEGARILSTDIAASNGLVHAIDRVIMPPVAMLPVAMSRGEARVLISEAINKGAPMFNHGNHRATVMIYRNAVDRLLGAAGVLQVSEKRRLEAGMQAGKSADTATSEAWQLRYALDDVADSLRSESESMRLTKMQTR